MKHPLFIDSLRLAPPLQACRPARLQYILIGARSLFVIGVLSVIAGPIFCVHSEDLCALSTCGCTAQDSSPNCPARHLLSHAHLRLRGGAESSCACTDDLAGSAACALLSTLSDKPDIWHTDVWQTFFVGGNPQDPLQSRVKGLHVPSLNCAARRPTAAELLAS